MFVYFAVNSVNLKMYIGKSRQPDKRWYDHVTSSLREDDDYCFHRAIRKYGPEAFAFDILEQCESDQAALDREIYWIETYDTLVEGGWGYNMTKGGDGCVLTPEALARRGLAISEALNNPETRQHRRQLSLENWKRPEYRDTILACLNNPEHKESQRTLAKARWEDEDYRRRCTEAVNHPDRVEQHRQLMLNLRATEGFLESQRELWKTTEYIAAQTAGVRTPEHRKLVSEASRKRWQDENFRKTHAAAMRKVIDTPENLARKAKIVELRKSGMPLKQICLEVSRSIACVCRVLDEAGLVKKHNAKS